MNRNRHHQNVSTTTQPPELEQRYRPDTFPGVLPTLPCGELTLLRLGPEVGSRGWWQTVGRIVEDTLSRGQRVNLVRVDGVNTDDLRSMADWNEGSGLLTIVDDADLHVSPWHQHLRPHGYACNVPTLHNVKVELQRTKGWDTPGLLMFDHFQRARPWRGEGDPTYPNHQAIPPSLLNMDRAGQIHALARVRWHSPTVIVWHDQKVTQKGALDALLDDARFVLFAETDRAGESPIRAYTRTDLVEEVNRATATSASFNPLAPSGPRPTTAAARR